ncbi:MAG: class B sortase, partial [Lachnospiraceae bacterium]
MQEEQQEKGRKKLNIIIAVLFGVAFLACLVWLVSYGVGLKRAESNLEDLKDAYVIEETEQNKPETEEEPAETASQNTEVTETTENEAIEPEGAYPGLEGFEVPEKTIDFKALQEEENADIYAWITVPGTKVDYPVLQHPEDPTYYLNYNIDGSKGYPGCIYTEFYNSKDWDDPNTVLYGHNMKNGTMFASLHYYEDPQFFEEYPYVYIYTEEKVLVYQIFAAYEFSNAHLLLRFNMDDPDSFA